MSKIRVGALIVSLCIPLGVGMVSAALTSGKMADYGTMAKPPLSPPSWVFPVAWTILYLVMGLASYYVFTSMADGHKKSIALIIYALQLVFNFMWSILFFYWGLYFIAFLWLLALWGIVIACAFKFYGISKLSGYLMIPYILWLTFAAYLNLGVYIVRR